jgi:hypothetical protein
VRASAYAELKRSGGGAAEGRGSVEAVERRSKEEEEEAEEADEVGGAGEGSAWGDIIVSFVYQSISTAECRVCVYASAASLPLAYRRANTCGWRNAHCEQRDRAVERWARWGPG